MAIGSVLPFPPPFDYWVSSQLLEFVAGCLVAEVFLTRTDCSRSVTVYSMSVLRKSVSYISYLSDRPSIFTLSFVNLGGNSKEYYFADGIVDEIITALSRFNWLFVVGRNSAFVYKGRSLDSRQLSRELGVRYILEGSIRKAGARVRVTAQLIEAASGRSMWGQKFEGSFEDIFSFQDHITESIVGTIEPTIRKTEIERARRKPTASLDAYDFYLRGLEQFNRNTRDGLNKARDFLKAAIELDDNFSEAWATLANITARWVIDGWSGEVDRSLDECCNAALRAVTIDPMNGLVLASASRVLALIGGRIDQGAELALRAQDLVPNSAFALGRIAWTLIWNGELEAALIVLTKAARLDPVDPRHQYRLSSFAVAYFFQGHFAESISFNERVVSELPTYKTAQRFLAAAYAQNGDLQKAQGIVAQLLCDEPSMSIKGIRKWSHFRETWMSKLYFDGLRIAGMPD